MAVVFRKIFFKKEETPFVMELPPYRMPTLRVTLKHMWHKGAQYLQKMGGVILIASIIIWALGYFPQNTPQTNKIKNKIAKIETKLKTSINSDTIYLAQKKYELKTKLNAIHQKESYIGQLGTAIQPIMKPLGFDDKMSVSLLTGIVAKEIVVSTMGVLYQAGDKSQTLVQKLKKQTYSSGENKGKKVFNKTNALAFLIFILIYFPCIATIAAVKRETGSWKWAAFMMTYTTSLAWILAFAVNQIGQLL
jgi:ferrous iron transport protein B